MTAVMTRHDQGNLGRTGLIQLMLTLYSSYQKKSGQELTESRNLEGGAVEATEVCCLPACFSWFSQSAFFFF